MKFRCEYLNIVIFVCLYCSYAVTAKRLGVPAERCVVVEDALTGVRAGLAAGMRVIACPDIRIFEDFDRESNEQNETKINSTHLQRTTGNCTCCDLLSFQKCTPSVVRSLVEVDVGSWSFNE